MKTIVLLCFAVAFSAHLSDAASLTWSYEGEDGPDNWANLENYEACGGSSQSPIDIDTSIAVDHDYEPFELSGWDSTSAEGPQAYNLYNNGHAAQVNLEGAYYTSGGGLSSEFQALQFHLHWGGIDDYETGAEHTKNGKTYPAEVHFVHYDHEKYFFIPDAIESPQGLAVLGFFFEIGDHNEEWAPIFDAVSDITYKDDVHDFPVDEYFSLTSLIPSDLSTFYRYNGSLTTPGCYETVIWTVFEETIKVSKEQIDTLKGLSWHTAEEEFTPLLNNYRPTLPLNERTLYKGHTAGAPTGAPIGGSTDAPVGGSESCVDRCGDEADFAMTCQCNSVCRHYGDCCHDYKDLCMVEVCSYVPTFKNKLCKTHDEQ